MTNYEKYIKPIEIIKEKRLISWETVAQELEISYVGFLQMKQPGYTFKFSLRTQRKMRDYLEEYKEFL
jgi:hypothetical protein